MSTAKLAAIVGVAAETLLDTVTAMFGQIGPCTSWDTLGGIFLFFHLPGLLVANKIGLSEKVLSMSLAIVIGAIPFFLMALICISIRRHGFWRNSA